MQALLTRFAGAADLNKNCWLMASELGTYLAQQMDAVSKGTQHPTSLQIDDDGDTVLVEGREGRVRAWQWSTGSCGTVIDRQGSV